MFAPVARITTISLVRASWVKVNSAPTSTLRAATCWNWPGRRSRE